MAKATKVKDWGDDVQVENTPTTTAKKVDSWDDDVSVEPLKKKEQVDSDESMRPKFGKERNATQTSNVGTQDASLSTSQSESTPKFELPKVTSNEPIEPKKSYDENQLDAQKFLQKNNGVLRDYYKKQGTYDKDFLPVYKAAIQGDPVSLKKSYDIINNHLQEQIDVLKSSNLQNNAGFQAGAFSSGMAASYNQTNNEPIVNEDNQKKIADLEKQQQDLSTSINRYAAGNPKSSNGEYRKPKEIGAKLRSGGLITNATQTNQNNRALKSNSDDADIVRQHIDYGDESAGYKMILDDLGHDYDVATKKYKQSGNQADFDAVKKIELELNTKRSEYNNLDLQYPEVAKKKLANLLTDYIGDKRNRLNPFNMLSPNINEIKDAFYELGKQYPQFEDKYNATFRDLILDKKISSIFKRDSPIGQGGLSGALGRGMKDVVEGFGLYDLATMSPEDRAAKQAAAEFKPTKTSFQKSKNEGRIVIDKENNTLVTRNNNLSNTWDNVVNLVGEQAPSLVAFGGVETLAKETIGKAIAGTLKGTAGLAGEFVEAATGEGIGNARQITKNAFNFAEGGTAQGIEHAVAMQGAQAYMSYAKNYDESLNNFEDTPEGHQKSTTSAALKTMAEGLAFTVIGLDPAKMLGGSLKANIGKDIDKFIEDVDISKLSKDGIASKLYDIIYPRVEKLAGSTFKGAVKMGTVTSTNAFVKDKIDQYLSGKESAPTTFDEDVRKQIEIFKNGALMGAVFDFIPNLLNVASSEGIAPSHRETLMNLALKPDESKYRAQQLFENGTITSDRRNEMIKAINTSRSALNDAIEAAKANGSDYDKLKPSAQQKLITNHFRQRFLEHLANNNPDLKEQALAEKDRLKKEALGLYSEERESLPITDNFVKSLDIKDENGENIKSISDLLPDKNYFINGEKKPVNATEAENHIHEVAVSLVDAPRFTATDKEVFDNYKKQIDNGEELTGKAKKEYEELTEKKNNFDKQQEFIKSVENEEAKSTETKETAPEEPISPSPEGEDAKETVKDHFDGFSHAQTLAKLLEDGAITQEEHNRLLNDLSAKEEYEYEGKKYSIDADGNFINKDGFAVTPEKGEDIKKYGGLVKESLKQKEAISEIQKLKKDYNEKQSQPKSKTEYTTTDEQKSKLDEWGTKHINEGGSIHVEQPSEGFSNDVVEKKKSGIHVEQPNEGFSSDVVEKVGGDGEMSKEQPIEEPQQTAPTEAVKDMIPIVTDLVNSGVKSLEQLQKIIGDHLNNESPQLKDIVEQAGKDVLPENIVDIDNEQKTGNNGKNDEASQKGNGKKGSKKSGEEGRKKSDVLDTEVGDGGEEPPIAEQVDAAYSNDATTLKRADALQAIQDEFLKGEGAEYSKSDEQVFNDAKKLVAYESAKNNRTVEGQLEYNAENLYNELFDENGNRKINPITGSYVQKALTPEEEAMLGMHSILLNNKIKELNVGTNNGIDELVLQGLMNKQYNLGRAVAVCSETGGRALRYLRTFYAINDKGEIYSYQKMSSNGFKREIPIDEKEYETFRDTLNDKEKKVADIIHEGLKNLNNKFDEIRIKRDDIIKRKEQAVQDYVKSIIKNIVDKAKPFDSKTTTKGKMSKSKANAIADAIDKAANSIKADKGNLQSSIIAPLQFAAEKILKLIAAGVRAGGRLSELIERHTKDVLKEEKYKDLDEKELKDEVRQQLLNAKVDEGLVNSLKRSDEVAKLAGEIAKSAKSEDLPISLSHDGYIREMAHSLYESGVPLDNVMNEASKLLKDNGVNVSEQELYDAYLKQGKYKQESSKELTKNITQYDKSIKTLDSHIAYISDIDKKISQIESKEGIPFEEKIKKIKTLETEREAKEKEFRNKLIENGHKLESGGFDNVNAKKSVLDLHNNKVKSVLDNFIKKMDSEGLFESNKKLRDLIRGLKDKLVKEPTAYNLDTQISKARMLLDSVISNLHNEKAGKNELEKLNLINDLKKVRNDVYVKSEEVRGDIALNNYKKTLETKRDDYRRRLNAGDFDNEVHKPYMKLDKEANELTVQKNIAKKELYKALDKAEDRKALNSGFWGWTYYGVSKVRKLASKTLISSFYGLRKIVASLISQTFPLGSKGIGWLIYKLSAFEGTGGYTRSDNSSYWEGIKKGVLSTQKGADKLIEEHNKNYDNALSVKNKAEEEYRSIVESEKNGENSDKAKSYFNNELAQAKVDYDKAAYNQASSNVFTFMIPSVAKSSAYILKTGVSKPEHEAGIVAKAHTINDIDYGDDIEAFREDINKKLTDGKKILKKISFFGGYTIRSHSVMKDIPSRVATIEGYLGRLKQAQEKGLDISDYDIQAELFNQSLLNEGQSVKFMDSNKMVEYTRENFLKAPEKIEKLITKKNEASYATKTAQEILLATAPVIKIGANIYRMAIRDYSLGVLVGGFDVMKTNKAAKEAGLSFNEYLKKMPPEYTDRMVSALSRGSVGLAAMVATAWMTKSGNMQIGGVYPDKPRKVIDDDGTEHELGSGEIAFKYSGKWHPIGVGLSTAFTHTPLGITTFIANHIVNSKKEAYNKGENEILSWLDALSDTGETVALELPVISSFLTEKMNYKTQEKYIATKNPFSWIGYVGVTRNISDMTDYFEGTNKTRESYNDMTFWESIRYKTGTDYGGWKIPTKTEAKNRKSIEESEREKRAIEHQSK